MLNEAVIRLVAFVSGVLLTPMLVILAFVGWSRYWRSKLPHWRNGIGLTSFLFVAVAWMWFVVSVGDAYWRGPFAPKGFINSSAFVLIDMEVVVPCTLATVLFATALKGWVRVQMVTATILLCAARASTIYH